MSTSSYGKTEHTQAFHDTSIRMNHLLEDTLYPVLLQAPRERLAYEYTDLGSDNPIHQVLDGQLGIDMIAHLTPCAGNKLNAACTVPTTYQFRTREAEYRTKYRDITMTYFNRKSGQYSEVHKIAAEYFVYGFHHFTPEHIMVIDEVIVVAVPTMMRKLANGILPFTIPPMNDKEQDFIAIKHADLYAHHLVVGHYNPLTAAERQRATECGRLITLPEITE